MPRRRSVLGREGNVIAPSNQPLWNADLSNVAAGSTGSPAYPTWEHGGTFDGTPSLSQRVSVGNPSLDGFSPPVGLNKVLRMETAPGDQYGGSTGWRTSARQHEPLQTRALGYESTYVWFKLFPTDWVSRNSGRIIYLTDHQFHPTSGNTQGLVFFLLDQAGVYKARILYGISGVSGSPDLTTAASLSLSNFQLATWHCFVSQTKPAHNSQGIWKVWHGIVGVNSSVQSVVSFPAISWGYTGGTYNGITTTDRHYPMGCGAVHYCQQAGSGTMRSYTAGAREYASPIDALGWANYILASNL